MVTNQVDCFRLTTSSGRSSLVNEIFEVYISNDCIDTNRFDYDVFLDQFTFFFALKISDISNFIFNIYF